MLSIMKHIKVNQEKLYSLPRCDAIEPGQQEKLQKV